VRILRGGASVLYFSPKRGGGAINFVTGTEGVGHLFCTINTQIQYVKYQWKLLLLS